MPNARALAFASLLFAAPAFAQFEGLDLRDEATTTPKKQPQKKKEAAPSFLGIGKIKPTQVTFSAGPGSEGAVISLDGQELGPLPQPPQDVEPGTHKIEAKRRMFSPFATEVTVKKENTVNVPVTLEAATGLLQIQTDPPEAEVFLDGEK